jgi:RNA polymerase sigma-70 factor (ECF subfamily)
MESTKQERFMQLYSPVHDRFERFCKTRAYGEFQFQDIMHDTLVVAYEKLDELKSTEAFLHYLFGTTTKILANQRKKKRPEYAENMHIKYERVHNEISSIDQQFEINDLYMCLKELDKVTSECIILFEISGFSIKEITNIQNSSESAVKQRLSRGRKQLLRLMNSLEIKNDVL